MTDTIIWFIIQIAVVIFAIMIHEISHGYVAYKLGDPTAKNAGRLTLNPAKHLDPVGSFILPGLMALSGGPIFAYAKPVPYNPRYFKNLKKGEVLVAFAGPASNLLQALVGAGIAWIAYNVYPNAPVAMYWLYNIMAVYVQINLVLMFFNLIPLPPLDGSAIIAPFLTQNGLRIYYQVQRYSMFILLALLFVVPQLFNVDPLGWYLTNTVQALVNILMPA